MVSGRAAGGAQTFASGFRSAAGTPASGRQLASTLGPVRAPWVVPRSRSAGAIGRKITARARPAPAAAACNAMAMTMTMPAARPRDSCSFTAQRVIFSSTPQARNGAWAAVDGGTGPHGVICSEDKLLFEPSPSGLLPPQPSIDFAQIAHAELDISSVALRLRLTSGGYGPRTQSYVCIQLPSAAEFAALQRTTWPVLTNRLFTPRAQSSIGNNMPAAGPSLMWSHF
eukprot:TRINITY_DN26983_c0_g1_i1.p1 TRINITY_DN26983_c0_g1~~TRINITY_DN26983_c0_g1_i1.p1  ORF type:complete len:264 (+),score=16.19 TRINITY_DN26983_c0_g1_i1:113-793(+)